MRLEISLRHEYLDVLGGQDETQEMLNAVAKIVNTTTFITCIAYLRMDCHECLLTRIGGEIIDWLNGDGYEIFAQQDSPQFWRQLMIFVKEWVEEDLKDPCTTEMLTDSIH